MYAMDLKNSKKRKRKALRCTPELLDELVLEILIRLPIKSLLRFKSVSKAWCAIIRDPVFIRMRLQHTTSNSKENPSFLITPHTLDRVIQGETWPSTFSTKIRFYQWQPGGASEARLMHGVDFPAGEFNSVCHFAHCDGLVVVPTDTKVYLFNPATRDTITLPDSNHNKICHDACLPVGLGRDPRSGRYKVVRAFFRSIDPLTDIYRMGMEVFTVGGASATTWRETAADPPYPVAEWITAKFVNGGLFWVINKRHLEPRPYGILRFSLEDEMFSVTCLPDSLDPALDESYLLDVMHGELCLTAFSSSTGAERHTVRNWVLVENDGVSSRWEQRYSLYITELIHPMALLPGGSMMIRACHYVCCYQLEVPGLTTMCELDGLRYHRRRAGTFEPAGQKVFYFNVIPYTESLVRVTA